MYWSRDRGAGQRDVAAGAAYQRNLDPSLRRCQFDTIVAEGGKIVLVLRIPASSNAPHMRQSPMDSYDVRAALLASENLTEKVSRFREESRVAIQLATANCMTAPGRHRLAGYWH